MTQFWTERIKQAVRPQIYKTLFPHRPQFGCPSYGYHGPFRQVDQYQSDRYNDECQLTNQIVIDGKPSSDYSELVRVPDIGFLDLIAVCHV